MLVGVVVLIAAIGTGVFCAVFPERAARKWGRDKIEDLPPQHWNLYFWCYRIFGILFAIVATAFLLKALSPHSW
jgi:hypothetical protein